MEQGFDLSSALGPVQKPSLLSTVKTAVLPFLSRPADGPSNSGPLTPATKYNFCSDGLPVSALANFVTICGGENKIKSLSTRQVVEKYILPTTGSLGRSYCELVKTREPSLISPASVYISHSWGARFMDTYRAIKYHFRHEPHTVIWMDIFCLNQRVFYPRKLRNNARTYLDTNDDGAYAVTGATAQTDPIVGADARLFSPPRRNSGPGAVAQSQGVFSVTSEDGLEGLPQAALAMAASPQPYTRSGVPGGTVGTESQRNGMHNMSGGAGDWCADILKHGMDAIGSVVLVLNPSPIPEPKSGSIQKDDSLATHVTKSDIPGEAPGSPDTVSSPRGKVHWDRARYTNPAHALSRLWCLYEVYCTTVVRGADSLVGGTGNASAVSLPAISTAGAAHAAPERGSGSRPHSSASRHSSAAASREGPRPRRKLNPNQCEFDIALHYDILVDAEHNTHSSNVKNKRSPFAVDLESTCRDFEHLTKWICCMDLTQCEASDAADAQRLLHIINVDIGAGVFIETVRNVLEDWVQASLNDVSAEAPTNNGRQKNSTGRNTAYNVLTAKQRLYVQHCVCKLYHVRGDSMRAEGSMIELGKFFVFFVFISGAGCSACGSSY
jgi:hypothetical protein